MRLTLKKVELSAMEKTVEICETLSTIFQNADAKVVAVSLRKVLDKYPDGLLFTTEVTKTKATLLGVTVS